MQGCDRHLVSVARGAVQPVVPRPPAVLARLLAPLYLRSSARSPRAGPGVRLRRRGPHSSGPESGALRSQGMMLRPLAVSGGSGRTGDCAFGYHPRAWGGVLGVRVRAREEWSSRRTLEAPPVEHDTRLTTQAMGVRGGQAASVQRTGPALLRRPRQMHVIRRACQAPRLSGCPFRPTFLSCTRRRASPAGPSHRRC